MKTSEDGKNDMGLGVTLVFKVSIREGNKEVAPKETWFRVWGEKATKDHDWAEWVFTFNKGKEDHLRFKEKDYGSKQGGFTVDNALKSCKGSKIELKDYIEGQQDEQWVKNREIKFWVDEEKCNKEDNSVTCDLLFSPDSKLKWKQGFKPTITFSK